MAKSNKIILASILLFFFGSVGACSALEVSLPGLGGNDSPTLEQYIEYFFGVAMALAGTLAIISFAIGAVQYMASAGNPTIEGDAKDRMIKSILGAILLLASYIILQTINPQLIEPSLTSLSGLPGVYLTGGGVDIPAPQAESDTSADKKNGYTQIIYKCSEGQTGPNLLVDNWPSANYQNSDSAATTIIHCGESVGIGASYSMVFETPGIYLYNKSGCSGFSSEVKTSSQSLSGFWSGKVKSVRFVNYPDQNLYYGVVVHQSPFDNGKDQGGYCTTPLVDDECVNVGNINGKAITIFYWNKANPDTSGTSVVLYSNPFGQAVATSGGFVELKQDKIGTWYSKSPHKLEFNWENSGVSETRQKYCTSFFVCPGSIIPYGNYLVGLYSKEGCSDNEDCEEGQKCVSNKCVDKDDDNKKCGDTVCGVSQTCVQNQCHENSEVCGEEICGDGEVCLDSKCEDEDDPNRCGSHLCEKDQQCVAFECVGGSGPDSQDKNKWWCQIFTEDIPNLGTESFENAKIGNFRRIYLIPTIQ